MLILLWQSTTLLSVRKSSSFSTKLLIELANSDEVGVTPLWDGVYLNPSTTSISRLISVLYRGGGGAYSGKVVIVREVCKERTDLEDEGALDESKDEDR